MSANLILAGMLSTALAAGGLAVAANGETQATPKAGTQATAEVRARANAEACDTAATFVVADAGEVTLKTDGSTLVVADIKAAAGWSAELQAQADTEVEVAFTSKSSLLLFKGELENGRIEADVEMVTTVSAKAAADTTAEADVKADAKAEGEAESRAAAETAVAGDDKAKADTETAADTQAETGTKGGIEVTIGADGRISLGLGD